jgi:hypothetical protein
MKDLDFIEIGTSDFDTLVQNCPEDARGIVIEPIKYYLDKLPNKPNITKLQLAVSFDDSESEGLVYYVHPDQIIKHNLPDWLRGCNKINDYHLQHILLNIAHLVTKESVSFQSIGKILKDHDVRKIGILKIDTEGADCFILLGFFHYLETHNIPEAHKPRQIIFENNSLTCPEKLKEVIKKSQELGYVIDKQIGDELILNYLV